METPDRQTLRNPLRRRLFWIWVVASALVALYVGIGGPLAHYFSEGRAYIAIASTALMFFLLLTGFGWLILYCLAGRNSGPEMRDGSRPG